MHDQRYRVFGKEGEFDLPAMREMIRHREVTSLTDIMLVGEDAWRSAGFYPDLQRYLTLAAQTQQRSSGAIAASGGRSASVVQLLAGLAIILVGAVCLFGSARNLMWGLASSRWPAAEATLIDSDLVRHTTRSKGRTHTDYELLATYTFKVDGRRFVSRGVSFGGEWFRSAQRDYQAIHNASPLLAYYDPSRPSNAVLHKGVSATPVFFTIAGIVAIAAGLLALLKPAMVASLGHRIAAASKITLGRRAAS